MTTRIEAQDKLTQRFTRWPLVRIVIAIVLVILPFSVVNAIATHFFPAIKHTFVLTLVTITLGTLGYCTFVRFVEKRPVTELAPGYLLPELGGGLLLGALLFTATMIVLYALGVYQITGYNAWPILMPALLMALSSSIIEELIFRGILFRIMEASLGSWIALGVTALIFGLLHLPNQNSTLVAASAIAIEAGIMLAAAYMLTRRLWLCIGIHMAWNFTQSGVFSSAVSGSTPYSGFVTGTNTGPKWLTGGEFGVEASLVAVIICGLTGLYFVLKAKSAGQVRKPFWNRVEP
jgi:membrane protease YdiL (CAAX protease family)